MAKQSVETLCQWADFLFKCQAPMKILWQTLADHFYPERADFTTVRNVGAEFADYVIDSYPYLIRRDMGNSLHTMLRDNEWFEMTTDIARPTYDSKAWLYWATQRMRKLFNHRTSNFTNASKQGDHDYVTFGQNVKSVEMNRKHNGLLFRCWHLRDCAWFEDENGEVCGVARKWTPTRRQLYDYFSGKNLHPKVTENLHKKPFEEVKMLHMVIPAEMYGDEQILERGFPYVSLYIDRQNKHIVEELPKRHKYYVVPRFQTISGSPFAYSPATTVGLPDARCLQAMTHTLLEAAERYARPPIVATKKAVRSDVDLSPDGVTWVDEEYDERTGKALSTLYQDRGGYPIGAAERERTLETLSSAFYLNKLVLPEVTHEMTAYEVKKRMEQFRRETLPLFAPIEAEDNGQVCELAFEVAMQNGMLGSVHDIPQELQGNQVQFKFRSPISQDEQEQMANRFAQVRQMLGEAVSLDPGLIAEVDMTTALRDAISGIGSPPTWLNDPEVAAQYRQGLALQQAAQMAAQAA